MENLIGPFEQKHFPIGPFWKITLLARGRGLRINARSGENAKQIAGNEFQHFTFKKNMTFKSPCLYEYQI